MPKETTQTERAALALLRKRVGAAFRHFPKGLAGDPEAIHQLRVAARRLRVALPLLARRAEGGRVRRALRLLRELARIAAHSRDLDVLLEIFDRRLRSLAERTPEQRTLRRHLVDAGRRSRARMVEDFLDLPISDLRRDLRVLLSRGTPEAFVIHQRLRVARDLDGETLLRGFAEVGDRFLPDELHALRRRARRLRYSSEVADQLRTRDSGASTHWRKLQEGIGPLHDRHVLSLWFASQAGRATERGQAALANAARVEAEWARAAARRQHADLQSAGPIEIARSGLLAMGPWPPDQTLGSPVVPIQPGARTTAPDEGETEGSSEECESSSSATLSPSTRRRPESRTPIGRSRPKASDASGGPRGA